MKHQLLTKIDFALHGFFICSVDHDLENMKKENYKPSYSEALPQTSGAVSYSPRSGFGDVGLVIGRTHRTL